MTDYTDIIQSSFGRANPALPATVGNIDEDPDKAQRAIDLARVTGTPASAIYGDLDEFERQHKAVVASDIVANNPRLADFVQSNPMVPKVANDDYGNLDAVSDKIHAMRLAMGTGKVAEYLFPGDPLKRFKGGGPIGDTGASLEDLQNHPFQAAMWASIATPLDLLFRGIGGTVETVGDVAGQVGGRETKALVEAELMGLTGRHGVHLPEEPVARPHQLDEGANISPIVDATLADPIKKVMQSYERYRPWVENGRDPLPTTIPEYDTFRAKQNADDLGLLKEASSDAQRSLLRDRNPDLFRDFIASHTDAEIGVPGEVVAKLYGDKVPEADDGLLGWVPGIQDKLALARDTGGDVSIPIADWLAKAEPEVMQALHDDIRVRPGGITANEAKIAKEVEPTEPLPELVPQVRAASALEPLYSIGDRKLELQRLGSAEGSIFGRAQGFHDFKMLDEKGNDVGTLNLSEQKGGKQLYVEMINGIGGLGPRDFGPALMRSLLRQIKEQFPNAESITGHRVSGAREKAGVEMTAPSPVVKLDKLDEKAFQQLLEGGKWETYSPNIQAYIKPDAARSEDHRQLVNIVSDELDRIAPKKTAIQAADTIKADSRGIVGQTGDESIRVGGTYIRYRDSYPIILYALDADNVLGTARHEAIHHLRSYGFFKPEEWNTLEAEALAGNWFKKYRIDERYPTANPTLKLEESIAEAYMDWAGRQDTLIERAKSLTGIQSPLDAIFAKMKEFFDAIKQRIGELLGKDPTWEDIFQKVSTGEVGSREGKPLDPRAYNESLSIGDKGGNVSGELEKRLRDAGMEKSNASWFANEGQDYKTGLWTTIPLDELAKLDKGKVSAIKRDFKTEVRGNELWVRTREFGKDGKLGIERYPDEKLSVPEDPEGGSRVFERANALGMTVDQFKRYDELIAKRHAEDIEAATRRAQDEKARELTKQWKEDRKALRVEVAADIRGRPDVAADLFLGAGELYGKKIETKIKLDADALTPEQKARLPRDYYGKDGVNPDDIANLFGYGSGDAMVDRLGAYNAAKVAANMSAKDFVSRVTDIETDRQMQMRHGVLENNIVDAVKEHVAGETQLDILAEETHALGMKAGQAPLDKAAITAQLKDQFAKMPLGSVSSDAYLRAAGKAGRAAELALLNNDPATAFRAKQQQWYATVIAREASQLERDIERFDKTAKRFSKREVATVDQQYTNFIHDILLKVGKPVRRSVQDLQSEIVAGEYKDLQSFVDGKNTFYLREVAVDERLFDPGFRKKFEDLTVDEFQGVDGSIKSMLKNGRDERKISKDGAEEDLDVIRKQMIEQLQQFQEKTYDAKGGRWMGPIPPKLAKFLRTYGTSHIQMENLFNRWDHDNPNGVFQQYVMRDLVDAANNESAMEKQYAARLREIDDKADTKRKVDNPIFQVPNSDQLIPMNRGNLRTILLNVGNASNLDKLARGYKLKTESVLGWVHQHATKADWDWAQKMWDTFADLKSEADVMYRNISGVAPESIKVEPIQTLHGEYKGGYYPVIYHPEFEGPSKKLMGKDALEQEGFVRATTPAGYTKGRTGYAGPMALDLDMLPARMKQMIHDIAMRPSVINASKIFYDKDIRGAISKHFGNEWRDMLVPYLVDVANSANYMPKNQRIMASASEFIRQNMISTLVGLNPGTVLKHGPTALAQSLHEVGTVDFLRALKGLVSVNERTGESNWQFAMRESEELQRRHQNYVETLGGATDLLQPTGGYAKLRATVQSLSARPVALSDLLSAVPTWLAQYEKTIGEGQSHGDSVYMADRAVRRAHGSVAITNRSGVMRTGAFGQWMSSVYGFFSHIMNRQYEMLWKAGEMVGDAKSGNYREAMQRAPELTSMLFAYVLAPALIEEMVTPLMSSENESWGKKAAKGVAFTLGASWIVVRDIANAILNGRDPSVGLLSTAFKTLTDPVRDLGKKAPFSKEHAGKLVKDGATMLGALSGVVPAQVGRVAEFGQGVYTGTERPKGPWGWLTGARYGTLKGHPATLQEWQKHHIGAAR